MRIGSLLGIPFVVNPLFLVLIGTAAYYGFLLEALALFAIVLWHEMSHALIARYHGISISEVELLPFGGVARLEELVQLNPTVEWRVAIAGPLSNLVLLTLGYLLWERLEIPQEWFAFFAQANLGMAVFNVLPALPLDGGRVLRSHLVKKAGFKDATERSAVIAQGLAVGLILLGLTGYYFYGYLNSLTFVVLGLFLFSAAHKEKALASYVFMRYLTRKKQQLRLQRVMPVKELVATQETSLGEVFNCFTPTYYHLVWVISLEGQLVGILSELEMINGLFEKGIHGKIDELIKYRL